MDGRMTPEEGSERGGKVQMEEEEEGVLSRAERMGSGQKVSAQGRAQELWCVCVCVCVCVRVRARAVPVDHSLLSIDQVS